MKTSYDVVLYGASGYTGKLTAWKLAERGIPFIAAGRNAERLQAELANVPELKGHDYSSVSVTNERKALAELFKGKKVVINIVGPFMQLGRRADRDGLAPDCPHSNPPGEFSWSLLL